MATWKDVQAFIHNNYKATDISDDIIKLVFETPGLRSQIVFVSRSTILEDQEWAVVSSPFAKVGSVDLKTALDEVSNYTVGGLYCVGDLLMVKDAVPLKNLDINELVDPMLLVLHAADFIEKKLGTGDEF